MHAPYDLTFLEKFSLELLSSFDAMSVPYESKILPCGHYT